MDEFAVGLLTHLASVYGLSVCILRLSIAHLWNIATRTHPSIDVGPWISTRNVLPPSINHAFHNFPSYSLFTIPRISLHNCHFQTHFILSFCCSQSQSSQSHILSRSHCYPTLFVIIASSTSLSTHSFTAFRFSHHRYLLASSQSHRYQYPTRTPHC